jgi:hypothetical protein
MKGVFESFVADAERGVTQFGAKTFNTLYKEVKDSHKYLDQSEYIELLDVIQQFETKYGKYVDLVLNHNQFTELSGSGGPKNLQTPNDWASAIRNLNRIIVLTDQTIGQMMENYMNATATKKRKQACRKSKQCQSPCVVESGLIGKKCTYHGNPRYSNK